MDFYTSPSYRGWRRMFERTFKVVFLNDRGVGKTTLLYRISPAASGPEHIPFLKANILERDFTLSKYLFKLLFWEIEPTATREVINKIFADADAIVTLFDVCNLGTLDAAEKRYNLISFLRKQSRWLVGNKIDLAERRTVFESEATKLAERLNANYIEISAKTGDNVEKFLVSLLKDLLRARLEEIEVTLRV
jgi:small GTP-binding protein